MIYKIIQNEYIVFSNVDEFLLCRPYVGIWALVVGRLDEDLSYAS